MLFAYFLQHKKFPHLDEIKKPQNSTSFSQEGRMEGSQKSYQDSVFFRDRGNKNP
jgi:hypothetical protein